MTGYHDDGDVTPGHEGQLALTNLWPCPNTACRAGQVVDPETQEQVACRVCLGSSTVAFDPDNYDHIPY